MNTINWTRKATKQLRKKATKQLRKIAKPDQSKIYDAAQELVHMPNVQQVKSLTRHQYGYRLRVGQYRVLFDWEGSINIVNLEEVKKRDERTY